MENLVGKSTRNMAANEDRVSMDNPEKWYGDAQEFWKVGNRSKTTNHAKLNT